MQTFLEIDQNKSAQVSKDISPFFVIFEANLHNMKFYTERVMLTWSCTLVYGINVITSNEVM